MVEGNKDKVNKFIQAIRETCAYRFYDKNKYNLNALESREEYYFDERSSLKEKRNQDVTVVTLETIDGHHIAIDLVGTKVIDMAAGTMLVIGKNFDIFAVPEENKRR